MKKFETLFYAANEVRFAKDNIIKLIDKRFEDIKKEKLLNLVEKEFNNILEGFLIKIRNKNDKILKCFSVNYLWWEKKDKGLCPGLKGTELIKTTDIFEAKQIIERYPYSKWSNVGKLEVISIKKIDEEFYNNGENK